MSTPDEHAASGAAHSSGPVSNSRPRLAGTLSDGSSVVFDLAADIAVLGRSNDCDCILNDPSVSRQHAHIRRTAQGWTVEDLDSANGVLVNGTKVKTSVLADRDTLTLGSVRLMFSLPQVASRTGNDDDERTVFRHVDSSKKRATGPSGGGLMRKWSKLDAKFRILLTGAGAALAFLFLVSLCGRDQTPSTPPEKGMVQESGDSVAAPESVYRPDTVPTHIDPPETSLPYPDQPAQPSSTNKDVEYAEAAQLSFDAGRLPDAIRDWRMALDMDPANEIYRIRLESAIEQLTARAEEAYRKGVRHYQFLRYEEAMREWNQVLHLIPDPDHPLHQNARKNLEQAQAQHQR